MTFAIAAATTDKGGLQGAGVKVNLRAIRGPWDAGWVLDKHVLSSTYIGDNAQGHPQFDTTRSEAGEAAFRLKYRSDWNQVGPLADALASEIFPKLSEVGFIVPMPASNARQRQPVTEVARALGERIKVPVFESLAKAPGGASLKDLHTKEEKVAAIGNTITVVDCISAGSWNVLLVDDLYDTGASMEAACAVLRSYAKVKKIYVAALTWK